ncbi:MAG: dihydropteroate synthase [Actinomycetota bacterium]|jgi:dihydropteroate synthase|nr:dihydropteroate synthase [Actinomycetota bacterium]MDQ1551143.1 dihydropteroate synthase [Actinomycetota bacterium]
MASTVARIRPTVPPRRRPVIVGVLNVTPDSFSDGGKYVNVDAAVAHAVSLRAAGADFIDVGGESTRPGADRLDPKAERKRVVPVLKALIERQIPVSIDTMNASTAQAAADVGVLVVNDVSGGLADPEMLRTVAETGVHYIASHWRGPSVNMDDNAVYKNVVYEVRDALKSRIAEMLVWGISPDKIVLDPGLGFAKTADHNWALLKALPRLESIGYPILIGASRKRFLAPFADEGAPTTERDFATAVVSALAAQAGVWGLRVHDVESTAVALDIWSAWNDGGVHG